MRKQSFYSIIIALFAFVSLSCEKKSESTQNSAVASSDTSGVSQPELTAISFKESSFDFGKINEGDQVEHTFAFTNTGDHPLVISNANASCGCTLPEWTKDPVMPGKDGKIKVKYDSSGKEGKINKTVTILANTQPEATVLNISVEVIKKDMGQGPTNQ